MSWSEVALGEVVACVSTADPAHVFGDARFEYIDLSAVDRETKSVTASTRLRGTEAPSRARQVLASNDVLVSTVRPNLNAVAHLGPAFDGAVGSTGFSVLRPTAKVDGRYLFHWVRSRIFIDRMVRRATGASYPAVSDRIVRESRMPLPALDEQQRIARILDATDALRAKRHRAVELADAFVGALFADLFASSRSGAPSGRHVALSDLLERIESGNSPVCAARPATPDEWGVLKLGAVSFGSYRPSQNKALLPGTDPSRQYEVHAGDVLLVRKNTHELVGASAHVRTTPPRLLLPDLLFRLVPSKRIRPIYLQAALANPAVRAQMQRFASGSAGSMPNISKARLRKIDIVVPPLEAQLAFEDCVNRMDHLRERSEQHLAHLGSLFASLQRKAFAGTL